MPHGIPVVPQCGATAERSPQSVVGGPRQQGNLDAGEAIAYVILNDYRLGASARDCSVRVKAAAAVTPLITLGPMQIRKDIHRHPREVPSSHAGTDRLLRGSVAYEFDSRARSSRVSRVIPSFCILAMRVVRFRPSLEAAPLFPPTTQFVFWRVPMMWTLSASARVRTLSP